MGVEKTVIERIEFDEDTDLLVARVRPTSRVRSRCGLCRRRSPGYDAGEGRRRWRALDLGPGRRHALQAVAANEAPSRLDLRPLGSSSEGLHAGGSDSECGAAEDRCPDPD